MTDKQKLPHIVVVGGGAGGLELVTALGKKLSKKNKAKVTLVDKNRIHIWKPLLHEVATGSLDTDIDAVVYRAHSTSHGYSFQLGELDSIDRNSKTISLMPVLDDRQRMVLDRREIKYDILVLAVGSVCNDFGIPGVEEHCIMLDSQAQAQAFRNQLLNEFLKNSQISNSDEEPPITCLAIVGAGATGVELSAELHHVVDLLEMYNIDSSYPQILSINLIEAGPSILPALPERIAKAACTQLEKLGVQVRTNTKIVEASNHGFTVEGGALIVADLMVWSAGVKAPDWLADVGLQTTRTNKIECLKTLKSKSDDAIYVIGDCCDISMESGKPVPPRAQAAHQMADTVARNICNELKGKEIKNFIYKDYGSLINLSRFSTVGSLMGNLSKGSMMIEGRIARFVYLSLYRMHQIAIHGAIKGPIIIILSRISKLIRPKIKLH